MAVSYQQVAAEVAAVGTSVGLALVSVENIFTVAHVSIPAPEAAIIVAASAIIGTLVSIARQVAGPAVKSALASKPKT